MRNRSTNCSSPARSGNSLLAISGWLHLLSIIFWKFWETTSQDYQLLFRITTKSGHGPFIAVYSLKVTLWLINFNWEIQRFLVRWGQGRERPRVSPRIVQKRQTGSTLVEALETSLEQLFPRSRFRWLRKPRKIFPMILVRSLTLVVSAGSKQLPEKECQVLQSQLCKPGAVNLI